MRSNAGAPPCGYGPIACENMVTRFSLAGVAVINTAERAITGLFLRQVGRIIKLRAGLTHSVQQGMRQGVVEG